MTTIAYLAGQFPLRSETFVYREVRELRRRGWNVKCVTLWTPQDPPPDSEDLIKDSVVVYQGWLMRSVREAVIHPLLAARTILGSISDMLAPGEPLAPRHAIQLPIQGIAASGLAGMLRQSGIQHIHCHFAHAPTTVGMYAARQLGVTFSFTGHANDLFQRRSLLRKKLERASFVSCISEVHRDLYQSIHARSEEDYPIIRAGVDVREFSFAESGRRPRAHIVTVCRLVEKKGVDALIRAFAKLPSDATLTIAGDGPLRMELEELSISQGLRERTRFLGSVTNDQVRELLRDADIFALPCRIDRNGDKDGIPVVLMEAMACAVPVVAGDLPAIRELVVNEETGLLVSGQDVDGVAHALLRLLSNRDLADAIGREGRRRVNEEFALQANVDRLEAAIWRATSDPRADRVERTQK